MIDHYKVLKVSPDATQETIRAQYLFLLQAFHPDKFAGAGRESHLAQAEAETKKLNLAYEALSHPVRRRDFDRHREAEMARSRNTSGATPRQPPRQPPRPPPPPPPPASTTWTPPPPPPSPSPHRWNVRRTALLAVAAVTSSVLVHSHWLVGTHDKGTASNVTGGDTDPVAKLAAMTPAQAYNYGYGEIRSQYDQTVAAVRDDLYPGSVTNQMRRRGGKTELTPANVAEEMRKIYVEVAQDPDLHAELRSKAERAGVSEQVLNSYAQGRLAAAQALNQPDDGHAPSDGVSPAAPPAVAPSENDSRPEDGAKVAEKSPLGDLVVSRTQGQDDDGEIWLDCVDDARRTAHLCDHDRRTGQVSFSPDEKWIVVTDGGGPGSSLGTELRVFRREYQNVYTEIPDAGIADVATRAVLRSKHINDTVQLGHVYAEVEGWSQDGQTLTLTVWGHGPGYPSDGSLAPTKVDYSMATVKANYPNDDTRRNTAASDRTTATPVLSQTPAGNDGGFTLYTDRRHGYSVMVPAILAPALQEESSGDSVAATSSDGRTKLLLRVKHGVGTVESLYKEWTAEHTAKDPGKVVDYKTLHSDWFVVSGFDGQRGYYVKVVVRGSEALFLCLEYDEKARNVTDAMLTTMSRSFTGDLNASSGNRAQAKLPAAVLPLGSGASNGLQRTLPNGAVADPYANYTTVRPQAVQAASQPSAGLSRVYTVPELKKLAGTHPTGAGLRGDFVLVKKDGNQVLLQSRMDMQRWGVTGTTNGQDDVYRGHTFVTVNCTRDMSGLINGQLVAIPAEQALRIISVNKNSQGQIDVEASF